MFLDLAAPGGRCVGGWICGASGIGFALAEAQIILATLLARFEIALADDRPVIPIASITLGPDHEPDFLLTPIVQARA